MKKLSSYRFLLMEVDYFKRYISELESSILVLPLVQTSKEFTELIKAHLAQQKLREEKYAAQAQEIKDYMDTITDPTVKQIATMWAYNGQSWETIADTLYMDRTTVARQLKKYCAKDGVEV